MNEYISFDSHKHYTLMEREEIQSQVARQQRIEPAPGAIRQACAGCEPGTAVAIEATGNWYWIVTEIEQASSIVAGAVEEQNAVTREIAGNVSEAATGTLSVSEAISLVQNTARSALDGASRVAMSSESLSEESERLIMAIDTFLQKLKNA